MRKLIISILFVVLLSLCWCHKHKHDHENENNKGGDTPANPPMNPVHPTPGNPRPPTTSTSVGSMSAGVTSVGASAGVASAGVMSIVSSSDQDDDDKHKHPSLCSGGGPCRFVSNNEHYDMRRIVSAIQFSTVSETILFNPCGAVSDDACPPDTSVCLKNSKNIGINYGYYKNALFSKPQNSSIVEGFYGAGELCNNGVPRKTAVQFVCNLAPIGGQDELYVSHSECEMNIMIGSPYACSAEVFCPTKSNEESCMSSKGFCNWIPETGSCVANLNAYHKFHHMAVFSIFALFVPILVVAVCSLCFCCIACKQRKNRQRQRRRATIAKKKVEEKKAVSSIPYEQVPVQHIQLVPANFAPYGNVQFPMYPLVVQPAQQETV